VEDGRKEGKGTERGREWEGIMEGGNRKRTYRGEDTGGLEGS
jgi:hypothetical protein